MNTNRFIKRLILRKRGDPSVVPARHEVCQRWALEITYSQFGEDTWAELTFSLHESYSIDAVVLNLLDFLNVSSLRWNEDKENNCWILTQ